MCGPRWQSSEIIFFKYNSMNTKSTLKHIINLEYTLSIQLNIKPPLSNETFIKFHFTLHVFLLL